MILNSPYITGSLTVTGNANVQGTLTVTGSLSGTASLALNSDLLQGTGSTGFTTTASFNEVSSSQQQISSSLLTLTASYTALSSSYTALSGSYNTFSGSASTRVTQIENTYATTGSNSFRANQSITGSLVVSSTITAQTLVVQTVTSSILYSSGSNIFGNQLANTQTFTGSIYQTGSIAAFAGSVGIGTISPGNNLAVLGADQTTNPTLGTNAGKFGIFNGTGAGTYGIIMGVINNGNSYQQVQRIDGTATAYNLLLQPSGGNVGIGIATANPSNKFEVIVASSNSGVSSSGIAISDGAANRTLMFLGVNTAGYTYIQSNQDNVSSRPLVLNGSGGNVGIGTASPNFKTHISTGSDTSITQPTAGTYGLYIQQNTSGNVGGLYIQDGASNSGNSMFVGDNNGAVRFVIDTDGKVGIGVTPSESLTIYGAVIRLEGAVGVSPFAIANNNSSGFRIYDYNAGVNRLLITSTGAATFSSGIAIGGATATTGGIQFPATAVAIADANNLDDYEEGTWTPTLTTSGGTPPTVVSSSGRYIIIGKLVTIYFKFLLSSASGGSGQLKITNAPFSLNLSTIPAVGFARITDLGLTLNCGFLTGTVINFNKYDGNYAGTDYETVGQVSYYND